MNFFLPVASLACPPSSPPQLPDVTFNAALVGRVIFTGDVYSELQCIDTCLRWTSCTAYNIEILGSKMRCSALANIKRREKRIGSFYRFFDREKIEKVWNLATALLRWSPTRLKFSNSILKLKSTFNKNLHHELAIIAKSLNWSGGHFYKGNANSNGLFTFRKTYHATK